MGLDEEYFTPLCDGNHQNLRLLHYPPTRRDAVSASGQKRGGVHSDYGACSQLPEQTLLHPAGGAERAE